MGEQTVRDADPNCVRYSCRLLAATAQQDTDTRTIQTLKAQLTAATQREEALREAIKEAVEEILYWRSIGHCYEEGWSRVLARLEGAALLTPPPGREGAEG